MTPEAPPLSRFARGFDSLLLVLALAGAFLASAFVARNSDVWLHLAAGRLIADGGYDFSTDPLSYATGDVRWVNHAWLTDWASYQLFRAAGGSGLVAAKAAMIAAAVAIGLSGMRGNRPRWLVALLATAAVAALSPRATLQPMVVSCVLLVLLLRCLQIGGKAYRAIPPIIAVWVNLDAWYVLGPAVTALHWVGHRWSRTGDVPVWLVPAAFAACLLSPFHIYGLAPPPELSPAFLTSELAHDPRIAAQFASYFSSNPLAGEHADSPAFWAYCSLALGGTIVLIAGRRGVERWEVLIWTLAVAISAWQARLVPFCALVAVPLLAPHVRSLTPMRAWGRSGRWGTLLAIAGCALAAWSGWLPGSRGPDRAPGFAVYADPTVVRASETLASWRANGELSPGQRILSTSADASNTLAWFVPGERGYLDSRWDLHARAGKVRSVNIAEDLGVIPLSAGAAIDGAHLKGYGVAAVLWYDPSPLALTPLLAADSPWRVLQIDGRAVWLVAKPGRADAPAQPWTPAGRGGFDADRLAFGREEPVSARPVRSAESKAWWKAAAAPGTDRNASAASASTYLNLHLASNPRGPALPLLAIRAARRAIAADPDDAQAWLALARAYAILAATVEGSIASQSGLLAETRRVQRIAALSQAIIANPDSDAAHEGLAAALLEVGYVDRALAQRRIQRARLQRRGNAERAAALDAPISRLEGEAFDRECLFQVQTLKMSGDPLGRARIALDLGLAGLAQEILLKSSPDLYGPEGLRLLAGLLTGTGQASEAETLLSREELVRNPGRLGYREVTSLTLDGKRIVYRLPAYEWFRFLLAAATGLADPQPVLGGLRENLTVQLDGVGGYLNHVAAPVSNQIASDIGLGAAAALGPRIVIALQRDALLGPAVQSGFLIAERADLAVLEGWCALEAGERAEALRLFDGALADFTRASDLKVAPTKALAELYRGMILKQNR